MRYDLLLPARVVFGWGRRAETGAWARSLGTRAFIVHGSSSLEKLGYLDQLKSSLEGADVEPVLLGRATREPTVADVDTLTEVLLQHQLRPQDLIIGFGGGSAIDLAKAVSAMASNSQGRSVREFLEGVGTGATLQSPPLPLLAIPTTAGTGTEATRNAVISVDNPSCKKSLRADAMVPRIALIDPEYTVSNPRELTASSGMDAITQLIESYISCKAQPVPRALCLQGLKQAIPALPLAANQPRHRDAREAMAHAALLSGISLANSGLGFAHGVAASLGAICGVNHGLACATLLPIALRVNHEVSLTQLAELTRAVLDDSPADEEPAADALIDCIDSLCRTVNIPRRIRDLGVSWEQIPALAEGSLGNSLNGNPRPLTVDEVRTILEEHW